MDLTLKVWRQKNAKAQGHFETYKVKNISSDSSFLEMLDILNEQLIAEGVDPVAVEKGCKSSGPVSFDHDCREGSCGALASLLNSYRIYTLCDKLLVKDIEHLEERAVRGDILNLIGLKMSFCLGVFLTPYFQC